ncbi:MAG: Aminopeptidase 2 mitochondrial [Chrysothrix sp. TS-e1954]|nr:MAG: Aminopeptidase 2 mitochondrial [Chrysothrix sp. TS-e1954]
MHQRDAHESSVDITQGREVLPTNIKPVHYDLTLEPDLQNFKYNGKVAINLKAVEQAHAIVLNTLDLKIDRAELQTGATRATLDVATNEDAQTTTFNLKKPLTSGEEATIRIDFTGNLNDVLAGFYRSSYISSDGTKKYMATSQMEATDARRAFPCWDEPALKATFAVTLVADKGLTCLSNMDVKSETEVDSNMSSSKKQAVTFNTTPLMSTYLLAFIVGELKMIESTDFRVPVRVFAPPDQVIERGRFSLDLAARTLDFYEKKFDSKFPLPKMDMIAIPDFSAGAMENWGLVTYRTVDLLFDEKTSGAMTKLRVAEVVAHELAHQWFGNLVTMDFWDGLWLNEGFATWMSWYACNHFYPEWKIWQHFVTDDLQSALSLDSLRSSHPIEVPVKRADEVNQIFDAISYAKGSCVLRMISKYLGEETFLEGIRRYLKKHAYGNTQTIDLWNSLTDASGKDVAKVMELWTKRVGYPVITVKENSDGNSMQIKQNRFLRTADVTSDEDKTIFPIFLALRTKKGVDEELTLNEREGTFKIPNDDFYKINADHSGLYRTFYESSRLTKLGEAAKAGLLPVEDRTGMLSDAGALAASGYQRSSAVLNLIKGLSNEPEYVVWTQLTGWVASLRNAWIFEDESTKDGVKAFLRRLTGPKAHELGWSFSDKDGSTLQQFKGLVFAAAGSAGDDQVVGAAKEMFERFSKGDREAINPNIRGAVYATALQNGGQKEWDIIVNEYRTAKIADERNSALRVLGRATQPELVQKTVDFALSDEVRSQDVYMPLGGLRTHSNGIAALWELLKGQWGTLTTRFPPTGSQFDGIVSLCTSGFTQQSQLDDVQAYFQTKSTKGFNQTLAQSMDAIRAKMAWVSRDDGDVKTWLKENHYSQ